MTGDEVIGQLVVAYIPYGIAAVVLVGAVVAVQVGIDWVKDLSAQAAYDRDEERERWERDQAYK